MIERRIHYGEHASRAHDAPCFCYYLRQVASVMNRGVEHGNVKAFTGDRNIFKLRDNASEDTWFAHQKLACCTKTVDVIIAYVQGSRPMTQSGKSVGQPAIAGAEVENIQRSAGEAHGHYDLG